MKYYPVFVRLDGRRCVVVGGGAVAERKVEGLLRARAKVTVVSPVLTPRLAALAAAAEITHARRPYRRGDLRGAFLAYAATGAEAVDAEIQSEAVEEEVLFNAADDPVRCSFISPAVVERGDLLIAASTSGSSPLLARRVREQLEKEFGPEYAGAVRLLGAVRKRLAEEGRNGTERRRILLQLVDSPLLAYVRARDWAAVERLLAEAAGNGYTVNEIGDLD